MEIIINEAFSCEITVKESIVELQTYVSISGVHFDTSDTMLTKSISTALKVFVHGVEAYHRDGNASTTLNPQMSCEGSDSTQWTQGDSFFKSVLTIVKFFYLFSYLLYYICYS